MKMKNSFTYFVFILFIFSLGFGSSIKISPTQQFLKMNSDDPNCTDIWVLPDENYIISSRWSVNGKGNLSKYILTAESIKLNFNYSYISNGKYRFCFESSKRGNFSGIIYFYSKSSLLEIGTWIDLDVESESVMKSLSLTTGKAVQNINPIHIGLSVVLFLLLLILSLVIKFLMKDKNS
jgi:hypothetical protein